MSQTLPIILNLIAALVGAASQYFYKEAANKWKSVPFYLNWSLALGIISVAIVMVLVIVAYRMGGKISVVFPIFATTFLWGTFFEMIIDKQNLTLPQWAGAALVIIGLSIIAIFGRQVG